MITQSTNSPRITASTTDVELLPPSVPLCCCSLVTDMTTTSYNNTMTKMYHLYRNNKLGSVR